MGVIEILPPTQKPQECMSHPVVIYVEHKTYAWGTFMISKLEVHGYKSITDFFSLFFSRIS